MTSTEIRMEALRLAVRVCEINSHTTRANTSMGMGVVVPNPVAYSEVTRIAASFTDFVTGTDKGTTS